MLPDAKRNPDVRPTRILRLALVGFALVFGSSVVAQTNTVIVTNLLLPSGLSGVVASGKFLYTVGSGLRTFDISNPSQPAELNATSIGGGGIGLAIANNYAFVINGGDGSLDIFDVSNPVSPFKVGNIPVYCFDVMASGRYVYLATGSGPDERWVNIYDVSNPANPSPLGQIDTGFLAEALSIAVSDNYVYMAVNGVGLLVSDVSDPAKPKNVGQAGSGLAWDLALSGGYAYVVGYTNGL